jgi:cytochrome P450
MARDGCPVDDGFTMLGSAFAADPFHLCAALPEQPVFFASALDAYVVTRAGDLDQVLPATVHYSSSAAAQPARSVNPINVPDLVHHPEVGRYVGEALTAARLDALEPVVAGLAVELIDAMVAKGRADLAADLGFSLPALVSFALIGFPAADQEMLLSSSRRRRLLGDRPVERNEVATAIARLWSYANDFVVAGLAEPGDGLSGALIRRHLDEPDSFPLESVVAVILGTSVAAEAMTSRPILSGLRALLEDQRRWGELVADPSLIGDEVEAMLALDVPVTAWRRRTQRELTIDGSTIPAGATIVLLFFAAEPQTCPGRPLAAMEMRIALEQLVERAPGMRSVSGRGVAGAEELLVEMAPLAVP